MKTLRKLLCKIGIHSKFTQYDKWGSAVVCRYCPTVFETVDDDIL